MNRFVIYTKGLHKVHKIPQKLTTNLRLSKAPESLSKVASNTLQTESSLINVPDYTKILTKQSITPSRVSQQSSGKIYLMVCDLICVFYIVELRMGHIRL